MKIQKLIFVLFLSVPLLFFSDKGQARSVDARVYIVPVGDIDGGIMERIRRAIPDCLPMAVKVVIEPQLKVPEGAYSPSRRQYNAVTMLDELSGKVRISPRMERALFVVDKDLFTPDLNFVFGLADPKKAAAVISLTRLRNEFYGLKPDRGLFVDRAVKEAVHELGHTWGMAHCSNPKCVMYFSNSLQDTDRKRQIFCLDCRIALNRRFKDSFFSSRAGE